MHRPARGLRPRILLAGALVAASATPLSAQSYRSALGLTGGWSWPGDLTPGLVSTVIDPGWTAGLQLEHWLAGGRTGLRLGGAYAERQIENPAGRYNIYSAGAGVLVRVLSPRPGRWVAPYVTLGAAGVEYHAMGNSPQIASGSFGRDPIRLAVDAGAGFDLGASRRVGLRLEVADRIVLPTVGLSPTSSGMPRTHNLHLSTALQFRGGHLFARPAAVAAAPPPPPPTAAPTAVPTASPAAPAKAASTAAPTTASRPVAGRSGAAPRSPTHPRETGPKNAPSGLYTVQIGDFVEPATAHRWAALLERRGLVARLTEVIVVGEPLIRMRVGALPSQEEAASLASFFARQYGWPARVDAVARGEALPPNVVSATRAFLNGG